MRACRILKWLHCMRWQHWLHNSSIRGQKHTRSWGVPRPCLAGIVSWALTLALSQIQDVVLHAGLVQLLADV